MAAAADIPLLITSENASSERRVTPSWTVAHFKGRLEPITGIPATCQRLHLKVASQTSQAIEAADEEGTQLLQWPLQPYAEIHVGVRLSFLAFVQYFFRASTKDARGCSHKKLSDAISGSTCH